MPNSDVREHPIIMSGDSVRAILDGCKSMTRRVVARRNSLFDGYPPAAEPWAELDFSDAFVDPGPSPAGNPGPYLQVARPVHGSRHRVYPRVQPRDRVWVREVFIAGKAVGGYAPGYPPPGDPRNFDPSWPTVDVIYRADDGPNERTAYGWRSPIHMPRRASRLTLEVTRVRVERLLEISEGDCVAEGSVGGPPGTIPGVLHHVTPYEHYRHAWDVINGRRGIPWRSNPWVWAYTFTRVSA